ncbi:leucyl aminopeptidase family protein [Polymorphobacter sp. PAMC 29334]|uniref:leucyl aminopeptidase family protein n=1 Tax=Polymorphobacter sp. PAMC 29334 TaxID=2862331 RepID=UPI001C74244F|nr:leucyl aminopeptidase family protein [Polymorphobacter sp. PAMC 29334]QYE34792.1 leucyl aminopeptidase family protein [Polymorphobacter sp. PAMC 29334]
MTDFTSLLVADTGQPARTIALVDSAGLADWLAAASDRARVAVDAAGFVGGAGEVVIVGGDAAGDWSVLAGVVDRLDPWALAAAAEKLPAGTYRLADAAPGPAAFGWLMAQHRFDRYRAPKVAAPRILLTPDTASIDATVQLAEATALVRDLVDTPAGDMDPAALADAIRAEGERFGAIVDVITGDDLRTGFPAIDAVGRAAAVGPRLIDLTWGDPAHPKLTLVGKGVTFDSGGLDIKPASGMRLMKKDMGGAAHALALARLVMGAGLPVRLRLIVPAVENAIAGNAFRPGDVLRTRAGITVEVGNTDAEGRLILADALALAQEDAPDLLLDMATLTGAARVALGPDLPALFSHSDGIAAEILAGGVTARDQLWRMPLWAPYAEMIKSGIADIDNSGEGGFAGCITAALFLDRFVAAGVPWAHVDLFAWNPVAKPGRPKGGAATGLRALWSMLQNRFAIDEFGTPSY